MQNADSSTNARHDTHHKRELLDGAELASRSTDSLYSEVHQLTSLNSPTHDDPPRTALGRYHSGAHRHGATARCVPTFGEREAR
jgi:hypothetical protein